MTFVVQGFPGNPVIQRGSVSAGSTAFTTSLPIPAAGIRQYFHGMIISFDPAPAVSGFELDITGLDVGGGSFPAMRFSEIVGVGGFYSMFLPRPHPAAATASAISLVATPDTTFGSNIRVVIFGYNVPE